MFYITTDYIISYPNPYQQQTNTGNSYPNNNNNNSEKQNGDSRKMPNDNSGNDKNKGAGDGDDEKDNNQQNDNNNQFQWSLPYDQLLNGIDCYNCFLIVACIVTHKGYTFYIMVQPPCCGHQMNGIQYRLIKLQSLVYCQNKSATFIHFENTSKVSLPEVT